MCKNKNMGGRCASHARIALMKAKAKLAMNPSDENRVEFDTAKVDYFSTPTGYSQFEEVLDKLDSKAKEANLPILDGIKARIELKEAMKGSGALSPVKLNALDRNYLDEDKASMVREFSGNFSKSLTPEQKEYVKLYYERRLTRHIVKSDTENLSDVARRSIADWQLGSHRLGRSKMLEELKSMYGVNGEVLGWAYEKPAEMDHILANIAPRLRYYNSLKMKACAQLQTLDPITRRAFIDRLVSVEVRSAKGQNEKIRALKETFKEEKKYGNSIQAKRQFEEDYMALVHDAPEKEKKKIYDELDERVPPESILSFVSSEISEPRSSQSY